MPRVIFKCPYLKGGSERAASHLHNYVRYMATREGAQHMAIGHEQLPATEEQRKMVAQLLREFPLSRGLFEYEDYQTAPTRGNASEFITRALEDNYDQIAKRDNYVSYIASRPRAQRAGAHALFTGSDAPLVLSQIAAEMEDPAESRKLRRELEEALQSPPVDGERTRNMALRLAEHRLNAIGAEEYETTRLQKLFRNHPLMEELERELLCESVRQITYRGKGIQVRLKNGQIMKGGQQP